VELVILNLAAPSDAPDPVAGRRRVRSMWVSIVTHAGLLGLLIAVPVLSQEPLPEPAPLTVRAFLVEPTLAPAPPPPPPPAARALQTTPRALPTPPPSNVLQAPIEVPTEVKPQEGIDLGVDGGVPGGVEGGVAGGVIGGVVGGLGDSPAPSTPRVVRVGGEVKEPTKLRNVNPAYPDVAVAGHVEGTVVLEATIAPNGKVAEVRVVRSLPLLEKAAVDAVKQWVYSPTLIDGVPVTAIMTVTVRFQLS
jgi:periplasmic protein TonB